MKKTLAAILTLALAFGAATPAFAKKHKQKHQKHHKHHAAKTAPAQTPPAK